MPMSVAERKHRLERGTIKKIALAEGVSSTTISRIVSEQWTPQTEEGRVSERRIRVRIARELGMRVDEVFPVRVEQQPAEAVA